MIDDVIAELPAQRTESAVQAFLSTWSTMCLVSPGGSAVTVDGLLSARTGLPVAPFNGIWGQTARPAVAAVLRAVEGFTDGELPWNLQLRPGYPTELDGLLADRGLVVTAQIPFMTMIDPAPLADLVRESSAALRELKTFVELDSVLSLVEQGFGMPPELTRQALPMRMLFQPAFTTWLVRAHDEDVSTALGVTTDDWTGVFNVATPEGHRGKGYGAVATAQAVLGGGGGRAFLQASPMGLPVYQRMGFETVETWTQWMPVAYAEH